MHMSDALLSPAVGTTFWAGSLGVITYCAKTLKENINDRIVPLMGVLGAFIFAAQMINFTIPATGSSGHLGGGMILAILLGPYAAFIAIASVLIVQCLFFADGGLLALGCNIWNLGVYPCFIGYPLIYRLIVKDSNSTKKITIASFISVVAALQVGAFSVVIQTIFSGRSELPFGAFTMTMLPIHFAIGLVEGSITAAVVNYVRKERPEMLNCVENSKAFVSAPSVKKIFAGFAVATIITGGLLSWFASTHPDGLEWSIEKIYGTAELPESEKSIAHVLKKLQGKIAVLPDYNFSSIKEDNNIDTKKSPIVNPGTSVSGIVGSVIVFGMIFLMGLGIKKIQNSKIKIKNCGRENFNK